ncbi:MAG: hypothetical protein ACUZ8E_07185 [Candidatus Anammoxibacter sp.]
MKIKIRGKLFDFFNNLKLTLRYASVGSTFSFDAFFDPENEDHRNLFRPYSYQRVEIIDENNNNDRLLTGTILNNSFNDSSVKALVSVSGYSLPGVLEDCRIPIELYPLQSDGKSLKEITETLIEPFGLNLVISSSVSAAADEIYEKTTALQSQTIKTYLNELALQKNIIISHTDGGSLLFTRARADQKPIARFVGGISGTKMSLSTSGQQMHSSITLQKQADLDNDNAGESTINNPFVSIFRPTTMEQSSGDDIDTEEAIKNVLSSELKSVVLTIETDRWTWEADGKVMMKPNNIITVHNHDIHLYQFVRFFVESIAFSGDPSKEAAVLTCVLPEVYNSQTPRNIFIIPNPHD